MAQNNWLDEGSTPVPKPTSAAADTSWLDEQSDVVRDNALVRGIKKSSQSMAITSQLTARNAAGAAQTIKQADDYARKNPGMQEGKELGAAWERGDGISGGISEVAGEFAKDWREAPGVIKGLRATGRNLRAFGEGIVEQVPNMVAPVTGMVGGALAGGAAGSAAPIVGNVAGAAVGGWVGASAGNTLVEGGGMTQAALQKAGINPQDTAAVEKYLTEHGDTILGQSATKGAIIGAVDTLTAGLGGRLLNAPARAAADRALAGMGVNMADKAAVKAARQSPEFNAKRAGDATYQASKQGAGNIARNAGAAALDPAGEFAGEFVGQGVATGEWDAKNAALEAFSAIGQSGAMFAGQKTHQALTRPAGAADVQQPPAAPPAAPPAPYQPAPSLTGTSGAELLQRQMDARNLDPLQAALRPVAGPSLTGLDGSDLLQAQMDAARQNPLLDAMRQDPARQLLDMPTPELDIKLGRTEAPSAGEYYAPGDTTNPLTGERISDQRPLSQQMGIDPTAGPLSKAATTAVDSGTSQHLQDAQFIGATGRDLQARATGPGVANESNVIDVQARVVEDRAIGTQHRLTAQESARESGATAFREGVPRSEIAAIPNVIHRAQQLRGYDDAAQKASSVPALPAPTNLREGLERIRAQKQEAANAQATAPQAAPASQSVPAAGTGAVEAAGPVPTFPTTGANSEPTSPQAIQASPQPAQAPATQGLTNAATPQNNGAQAAPAPGAQAQAQGNASWAALTPEQRRRARLEHEIATGQTNNGGVVAILRPSAIEKRKQELAAMGDAGKLPSPGPAEPLSANGLAAQGQAAPGPQGAAQAAQAGVAPRPKNWRTSMLGATPVAKAMGIDTKGKRLAQVVAEIDARDTQAPATPAPATTLNTTQLGRDNTPLSEGGKPFKTRKAAGDAKKLQPMMRVVTVPGGYALAEKTPAQLAAEERASSRLRNPNTSARGEPIPAHAFIAAAGGLNRVAASDMGVDGNPRIGNRTLFAGQGRGLSMDQATQILIQDGYLSEGATINDALSLIKTSLTRPQYNADGIERIAQAESDAQFEDYLAAQEEAAADGDTDPFGMADEFTADELEEVGYTAADPALQAEVAALIVQAEAIGIDTFAILEDIARTYANATQDQYNAAARDALAQAIARGNQDGGSVAAQAAPAAEPAAEQRLNQPDAPANQAQEAIENVADSRPENIAVKALKISEWADRETAPIGTWVKADYKLADSQPIYQVRELPLDNLYLPEAMEDGRLQPEKRSYVNGYADRLRAGEAAPGISVIEMEDGRMRVVDGHRRVMAARAAGRGSIRALVSPLIDTPGGKQEATIELLQAAQMPPALTSYTPAEIQSQQQAQESKPNQPPARTQQAQAATENVAQTVSTTVEMPPTRQQESSPFARFATGRYRIAIRDEGNGPYAEVVAIQRGSGVEIEMRMPGEALDHPAFSQLNARAQALFETPTAGMFDAEPPALELASQTPAEAAAQQEAQEQAAKAEAARQRAADAQAARDEERKRIAQASVRAADSFELGQDPMDSLTGQGGLMFSRTGAKSPNAQQPTTRAWYDRFVSLLPASYRNDSHRREPLPAEDWNVQRSAEVREKIDALNKQLRGANDRKGYGPVSADGLGNLQVDARSVSAADLSGPIRALADELGAGVAATNVRSGDVRTLLGEGFVYETSLAAIADRLMGRPFAQPVNTYTKDSAPGTILTYKPRGFPAALFSRSATPHADSMFNGKEMANAPMPANAAPDAATTAQPLRTPASTIRAAITKAYGKLLGQLESKGLVTLTQTEDEAIEAAAQARAAKTGQSVEQARSTLRASVKNSVADQTQTENFQRWFKDSKVVDADGKPLVVYHGTLADFSEFDGKGLYFVTPSAEFSEKFTKSENGEFAEGAKVMPVYVKASNPFDYENKKHVDIVSRRAYLQPHAVKEVRQGKWQRIEDRTIIAAIKKSGFDGIYVNEEGVKNLAVFDPSQLKSATGNNGDFDPSNLDIRRSANGAVQGFFDPQTGQSFLIADNLTAQSAPGVLMHEVGIHMAADGSMKALFNRAAMMLKLQRGNPFMKAVQDRMDAAGETSGEEAAAYIAEAYENDRANVPASVQRWLADLLAAVKAWMFKKGIMGADRLTVADIAAVARANARSMARDGGATGGQGFGTAFSRTPGDQTQTEAFKRWFKNSKVVDAEGKPLVVYHGTHSSFTEFKPNDALGGGMFFSPSPEEAGAFTGATGSNIMPVYLSAQKVWPKIVRSYDEVKAIRAAKSKGYDAIRVRDDQNGVVNWVVFDPTQVKSATGNNGDFDPANADIRFSRAASPSTATAASPAWDAPVQTGFDDVIYKLQDKHIDTKRVLESIRATGKAIADDLDVYLQEELYHGRAAKRTQDFVSHELEPLMKYMADSGLKMQDVQDYLHARHAKEANRVVAQRNPGLPDGGSGMTDAEADAVLASFNAIRRAQLERAAARVDAMIAGTRQAFVEYGLESQDTVDGWAKTFAHYVPLMREQDGDGMAGLGTGQGFSIKGREVKGRTGSTRKVVDILANIAMQRERAIVRGEKNRVATALVGLAKDNPSALWQVDVVPTRQTLDKKTGMVTTQHDPLYKQRDNVVVAKIPALDKKTGKVVVKEHAVVFNEGDARAMRMATALKNLDAPQLEGLLGATAQVTRYLAAINTQYNPIFGVTNLARDVQGAALNLAATPLAGKQREVLGQALSALAGIYSDERARTKGKGGTQSQWAQLWEEFQSVGGQTGYRDQFRTSADRGQALAQALDPSAWTETKWGQFFTAGGRLKVPMEMARKAMAPVFAWLDDYNTAMENGVRLAAYKTARDAGMSKERAASLAKNLTTNFNRKGQSATQVGALYAFFNASVQGTARIGQTLFDMEPGQPKTLRLSSVGKKIVAGGVLLGSMQALLLAAAGFDDEEPPDFVRERNLVIPTGGKKYLTIPMPLGFHVLPNLGRIPTEFVLSGFSKPAESAMKLLGLFSDTFNPIGNAGLSMQTLAPTVLDPLAALAENKDFSGRAIAKESFNKMTPGHALARDTASLPALWLAEGINYLTGGTRHVRGALSPTPDQIDYLVGQVTGGVGREATKAMQTAQATASGDDLPAHKVLLLGRFYGNADSPSAKQAAFYRHLDEVARHAEQVKGLRLEGKGAEALAYAQEHPQARLHMAARAAQRQIKDMRERRRELEQQGASREEVRALEQRMTQRMERFNALAA